MRVACNAMILSEGEYSGVHATIRETLNALQKTRTSEDEAVIYTRATVLDDMPKDDCFRIVSPWGPFQWRTTRILWEQFRLPSRVFKDGCDVLHGWTYIVPRLCLKPMVVTVHDLFALQRPDLCTRSNRSHFKRMMPISLTKAVRIVTPTEVVRQDVIRWGKEREEDFSRKTVVIPWGVNHAVWHPASQEERSSMRVLLGIDGPFFLIVARPEPKKNISLAIGAWFAAAVAKQLPHAFVLVGPRGWGVNIEKTVAEHGMDHRFKRVPFASREMLRALYSEATALLIPSLAEGFGLPMVEGMACGAPVLASDISCLQEVAGRKENALFSDPYDLKKWREALERIALNEKLRNDLSRQGLKRAAEFSWEKTAELYWKVYREVYEEDKQKREGV